jgi:hypothetical protein
VPILYSDQIFLEDRLMKTPSPIHRAIVIVAGLAFAVCASAADIVVVMAPGAPALSKDQVVNVYIGRNKDLKPLDLPESGNERGVFYKKATDRDLAQIKAVWARIAFTGLGQPPKELPDDEAIKKAVAADPKAIGYIQKTQLDDTVKVVLDLH